METTHIVIQTAPVQSSNIDGLGYDHATQTLAVKFKSGGGTTYHYAGVPAEVYEEMKLANSIGSFFQSRVRGKFPTTKYEPETEKENTDGE
jgi:hypothetical protein